MDFLQDYNNSNAIWVIFIDLGAPNGLYGSEINGTRLLRIVRRHIS